MNLAWTTNPLTVVLTALVAYRLTRLWISDTLPPLPRLRDWFMASVQNRWDRTTLSRPSLGDSVNGRRRETRRIYRDTPPLMYLLDCYWCSGFWISLATAVAATLLPPSVWTVISVPLALSAVVGLIGSRD